VGTPRRSRLLSSHKTTFCFPATVAAVLHLRVVAIRLVSERAGNAFVPLMLRSFLVSFHFRSGNYDETKLPIRATIGKFVTPEL
jgi:hypothetical protein